MSKYKQPLRKILLETRNHWDKNTTRPAVRRAYRKTIKCRTFALGALLFASENELRLVPGTCKSRGCPSCGQRNTEQWQREQWAALPDMPYKGITLTMPDVLWPLFQHNRKLLACLSTLGAKVIENWAKENYGVELLTTVVPHTFGRHLTFNPHLHIIVSVLGLRESEGRLVPAFVNRDRLMRRWRLAVITLLRTALKRGDLVSEMGPEELDAMLTEQSERWWSVHVTDAMSKTKLLRYIGRYVRRPPIAEHRIIEINNNWVVFWTKDHKLKARVETWYSCERFVELLGEHIPDDYRHAIHHCGLLSPRGKNRTSALIFALLVQPTRPRPKRRSWAESLKRMFNYDPLVDSKGAGMSLVRRLAPEQILELRHTLPREFNLSPNVLVVLGLAARRWLAEHIGQHHSPIAHRGGAN
jgi:hypothetical protein